MEVKSKTNSLSYHLLDPGFTMYHRAALGGLASTILAWAAPPPGISAQVKTDEVEIAWHPDLAPQEAVRRILKSSFLLTEDHLIDLPGHRIAEDRKDLRVAIHNAITQTFLQHPKSRPGEKSTRSFLLKEAGEEEGFIFSYKPVLRYTHQTAQGMGLLDDGFDLPATVVLPQAVVPGAFSGARALDTDSRNGFLLLYLMVGSAIFHLRPRKFKEKAQYCIVIPNVTDLKRFSAALHRLTESGIHSPFKSNTLCGRVVGGAEEAALRFLTDFRIAEAMATEHGSIDGCHAVVMGKVAWDVNQMNRSMSIEVRDDYLELDTFRAAQEYLGNSRLLRTKRGEGYVVPRSDIPELIAANLANDRHWCSDFSSLMHDQKDARKLYFEWEGLRAMKTAIKNEDDKAIIAAFQDAWRRTLGEIAVRAHRDHLDQDRLMEVEREKVRNAILRAKTSEMLAGWFLRFCTDATKGGSLKSIREESERLRRFIFDNRNFERFQNLCLFALVSYEGKSKAGSEE